jgi:hypothetical protein
MNTRFISIVPALAITLALSATLLPAGCHAQTAAPAPSASAATVANAVRIFPRAGFAAQMVGGEIRARTKARPAVL